MNFRWNQRSKTKNKCEINDVQVSFASSPNAKKNPNETVQNCLDRMTKDAHRRNVLVKERERLRIEIETLVLEKLRSTPVNSKTIFIYCRFI